MSAHQKVTNTADEPRHVIWDGTEHRLEPGESRVMPSEIAAHFQKIHHPEGTGPLRFEAAHVPTDAERVKELEAEVKALKAELKAAKAR